MSELSGKAEWQQASNENPCDAVSVLIESKERDLGGFTVSRALPSRKCRMVGPWIFFDHMGPAEFSANDGINVRPHPHINLATVTYLFEGEILHRDSLGYVQPIRPGAINLMVAGKGIVHSEREDAKVRGKQHRLHGLQLWMALPESDEECDPAFFHYSAEQIPAVNVNQVPVRVLIGSAYGVTSPVKTFAETLYAEAELAAGQSLTLPTAEECAVYAVHGDLDIHGAKVTSRAMAVLERTDSVEVTALTDSRIAIIGGEKMNRRHMFWNFASSDPQRIERAKDDWKNGKFPTIPGDDEDFIPLPD